MRQTIITTTLVQIITIITVEWNIIIGMMGVWECGEMGVWECGGGGCGRD